MDVLCGSSIEAFVGAEAPAECEHRRSNSKRDNVGKRIELHAAIAGRFRQPSNSPIESIEDIPETDENRRVIPISAERRDDGVIAAEDISNREKTGNNRQAFLDSGWISNEFAWASGRHV